MGRKIHLIGHSLGGVIALSGWSKTTRYLLGYYPGLSDSRRRNQQAVLHAAEAVRLRILQEHGRGVLPDCYTGRCTCNFVDSLKRNIPDAMMRTAIYTVMTASPRLNPPSEMRSRPPPALPR